MKLHFVLLLILTLLFTACGGGGDFNIDTLAPSSPTVTSKPTQSNQNSITIEINGEVDSDIYVNGIKVLSIGSTGKENITLSLAGVDGAKDFSISLKDVRGNESEALIFSIDKDAIAPIITLNGDANISLYIGRNYNELNATAYDARDGNVSSSLQITGTVNNTTLGTNPSLIRLQMPWAMYLP